MTNDIADLVAELRGLLDAVRLPLSALERPDYAEIHDEDGVKVALSVKPELLTAAVNALPTLLDALQSLQSERDELERILKLRDQQLTDEIALSSKFAARFDTAQETIRRQREALTPSGETKMAYIGEVKDRICVVDEDGHEHWHNHTISWDAIKAMMKMMAQRAALEPSGETR